MGPRIVVIGGGSAYMPGIAFAVAHTAEAFAGGTLVLHDIDRDALDLQRRLTTSILRSRGAGAVRVEAQPDRLRAMEGADVVLAAFRPGGLGARHLDEQIAMDHGIVGQETAGPGGFAMALRSVPIVLEIAAELARVTDDAVLLNYTNPVQIVSEAVHRFAPGARYLGLCDQTAGEQELLGRLLGVPAGSVELDTRGTNHMTFTQAVRVDGSDVTDELWALLDTLDLESLPDRADRRVVRLFRMLRCVPSEYLQYFFFHDEVLAEQRAAGRTRAQEIMAILPEVVGSYRREADAEAPRPSMERASEGHGDFAVSIAATMLTGSTLRTILNLPNLGQVEDLPRDAIVETPAMLRGLRAQPISQGAMPSEVSGLVRQVASHAALTAEAALAGDRALAVKAMAIHPLVRSVGVAESLVDAYLAAHAAHLPRFHPG